ncbi:MAG TPA: xanthine dehydrogenase family protein molybdopterin-binding subunit [Stellaceae bacterium]|nr:xanthine dehydrogenase family protein molybdopterin-binding subunit [Stellaceae bacterium]
MTAATQNTGIGAPVPRVEDERLLTGRGRYADDVSVPGATFAYVVRSPHAHARIGGIDKSAAAAAPGVLAVLTGEDVAREKLRGIACAIFPRQPPGSRSYCPDQPILALGKVRHVGDRVALVVAETLAQAKDAAELLDISYQPLPAVTLSDALAPDAAKVWDESAGNVSFQLEFGERRAVDEQFAAAAHVTTLRIHYPRAAPNTMEPRAAIAYVDPSDGRFTIVSSTQHPFRVREMAAHVLGIPELSLKVRAMDVGGAFGMKSHVFPEEMLVAWAAAKLDRPVKWTGDRSESIASDMHGRHQIAEAALALDGAGRVLAFRTNVAIDVGAYLSQSAGVPPNNAGISYPGTYRVPLIHAVVRAVFTNTTQLGVYRGSAKPEASFVLERVMDTAAREMGIDPVELRRRNLISPSEMPYRTPGGYVYDSGNFAAALDKALALADWNGFAARRALSERRGVRRGIGIGMHCQRAGNASERMEIRVSEGGSVAIHAGTLATGQGHETMFAQMISDWLGVPFAGVRVFQGDTDKVLFGRGSYAQRSMSTGGSALKLAADEVVRKAKRFAAWMMEVAEPDVAFERGVFRVAGTDRQLTWREVAQKSYAAVGIPSELGVGLDGVGTHPGPDTFPNGCIIAEVEVDPETGVIALDRLSSVDDAGTAVNPLTLEGQLHGSLAQAVGETLLESVVYERGTGQLLTGSFMDYAMPRADVMPAIVAEHAPVPTKTNLLGTKGGSEAGNVGGPAAIVNAVLDALSPWGVKDIALPARPETVWRALQEAAARRL